MNVLRFSRSVNGSETLLVFIIVSNSTVGRVKTLYMVWGMEAKASNSSFKSWRCSCDASSHLSWSSSKYLFVATPKPKDFRTCCAPFSVKERFPKRGQMHFRSMTQIFSGTSGSSSLCCPSIPWRGKGWYAELGIALSSWDLYPVQVLPGV